MKKEDLYLNENACEILLNISALIPFITLISKWSNVSKLETEITSNSDAKKPLVYKINYSRNSNISISCEDGRELSISLYPGGSQRVSITYRLGEIKFISYTLKTVNYQHATLSYITEDQIKIDDIEYGNYRFKTSLVPLNIHEDIRHNKNFSYKDLGINSKTLEPIYYGDWLPSFDEVKSFSAQQERIKISRLMNSDITNLSSTTKGLLKGLDKSLESCEKTYQIILEKYNEWLNKLKEHKELIDLLYKNVFSSEELEYIANSFDISLDNENAKHLIKELSPNMIEALKRQLNK